MKIGSKITKMNRVFIYCSLLILLCACNGKPNTSKPNTSKADNKEVSVSQVDSTNITLPNQKESLTSNIQSVVQKIENASLKKAEARYSHLFNAHDGAQYIASYDKDQLVKLSSSWGEGPYSWTSDYYLQDGALIFYYHVLQQDDGPETQTRYYVNQSKIIKGLIKEGTPPLDEIENKPEPEFAKDPTGRSDWLQNHFKDEMQQYQLVKPAAFHQTYTKEEKENLIMNIRKEFERIEATSLEKKVKEVEITVGPEMGETVVYSGYFDKGKLVKILVDDRQTFYLKDDILFFIYENNDDEAQQAAIPQSRYYFHDFQMIEALIKKAEPSMASKNSQPHPCLANGKLEKTLHLHQELELARARADF